MTQTESPTFPPATLHSEANASGVSWSAVVAGAFAAVALYLILLALGAGLGLSAVSVWSNQGVSASTFGTASILWIIFIEIASSSMGGYLAGRLRTRWTVIHGDEVYFRDTAHGFLSWSAALVVTAALLGSAATVMTGNASQPFPDGKTTIGPNAYFVDTILRMDTQKPDTEPVALREEVATILTSSLKRGDMTNEDEAYLDRLVSSRTGLNQAEAHRRVSETYTALKQATETTRKATAHTLLWIFIALLIGAFCASVAGTIGGRQRDKVIIL